MPPTMTKGSVITAIPSSTMRPTPAPPRSSLRGLGSSPRIAPTATTTAQAPPSSSPGMTPARKRSMTESPLTAAMMIASPEGGMIGPMMEEATVTAAA